MKIKNIFKKKEIKMKIFKPYGLKGVSCVAFYKNVLGIEIDIGKDENRLAITFIPIQNNSLQRFKVSNNNIGSMLIKYLKQHQEDIVKKLYIKCFGELYGEYFMTPDEGELTQYCIWSPGSHSGLNWYYPRFLNFLDELQQVLDKKLKEVN